MPKPKIRFSTSDINRLNSEISLNIGFRISGKPDCENLSEILVKERLGQISASTLYRLFFMPESHSPYKSTLDILCRLAGYSCALGFLEGQGDTLMLPRQSGIDAPLALPKGLIFHCIENKAWTPLHGYFDDAVSMDQQTQVNIGLTLFDDLTRCRDPKSFYKDFHRHTFVREYLLEILHDPYFRLNGFDAAYRLYLSPVARPRNAKDYQDWIFGNSVLLRYHYLRGSLSEAKELGQTLYKKSIFEDSAHKNIHIFPYSRYMAYHLWHLSMEGASRSRLAREAERILETCHELKARLDTMGRYILFHTVAEAFVHTPLELTFHKRLMVHFEDDFKGLPAGLMDRNLKFSLRYFDCNGIVWRRKIAG